MIKFLFFMCGKMAVLDWESQILLKITAAAI